MKKLTTTLALAMIVAAVLPLGATETASSAEVKPLEEATEAVFCSASAYCEESGTWLYCSGYHICNGVDQDCSIGERGSVFCKGGLIQWCPPCPAESVE